MGEVISCFDHNLGREVAIKRALDDSDDPRPSSSERFVREARIQGQLQHPSVVPVYDAGASPDGSPYFTMKRVRGRSLTAVLDGLRRGEPGVSRRKLLSIVNSACLAIDFCHARGVVHRDLKPPNIMIGDFGEVYVLDWGVASLQRDREAAPAGHDRDSGLPPISDGADSPTTHAGQIIGTPGYMAPEQLSGAPVDRRADVYGLGVLLYEVLTLAKAHAGDAVADVMVSTMSTDGLSPAARAPERDVPPELDELCRQATRRNADDRLTSARELSRRIEAFLDGDRDLELRRAMAAERAENARAALKRSRDEGADEAAERGRALREASVALGLDPQNPESLATLVQLLAEPPRATPPEAQEVMRASARDGMRFTARAATFSYLSLGLFVPAVMWLGVRDWAQFALLAGLLLCCVASSYYWYKRPPDEPRIPWAQILLTNGAIASVGVISGPLIFVPLLAYGNAVSYISASNGRRLGIVLAGCAAVIAPLTLQALGVLPPSYAFSDGAMQILPAMTELPETPVLVCLLLAYMVLIVGGGVFFAHLRDNYLTAERKLQLYAWQLRQIVPEQARDLVR